MTTTIEHFLNNKRKFLSDDEGYPPSACFLSITNQIPTSCNTKKLKTMETDVSPSSTIDEIDDMDDMMVCEDSTSKTTDIQQTNDVTNKSSAMIIPKHCDDICNADASPTTLLRRCYCDPYRFNMLIPYNSDIY